MHVGSGMSFILTIVVSTTKNIAKSKERRVSAEVLVIGSYAAPDHRVAPRVWGDVLSLFRMRGGNIYTALSKRVSLMESAGENPVAYTNIVVGV